MLHVYYFIELMNDPRNHLTGSCQMPLDHCFVPIK